MIRRPPRSTLDRSSAASDVYKRQKENDPGGAILRKAILESWTEFNKKSRYKDVKLFYDVDPQSIM